MPKKDTSERIVPCYIRPETQLKEIISADGDSVYMSPYGYAVYTYAVELEFWLSCWISQLNQVVELFDNAPHQTVMDILETHLSAFTREKDELFNAIDQEVGEIEVEMIGANRSTWRVNRVVGARIKPAEKEKPQ